MAARPRRVLGIGLLALAWLFASLSLPASARADTNAPAHYEIDAHFDPANGQLRADVQISLPPAASSDAVEFFLGERFTIDRVDAGADAAIQVRRADEPLPKLTIVRIEGKNGPPKKIRFRYHGPIDAPGEPSTFSPERVELGIEAAWLPTRADLRLLYSLKARIQGLPQGVVAVGDGRFHQAGNRLDVERALPGSDLVIVAAPGLKRYSSPDLDFWTAEAEDPLVATLHKYAQASAASFRRLYGAPATGRMQMAIVPRASSGGYARTGIIVMPTFRKSGDPTPEFDQPSPARFVAHEFSHAWLDAVDPGFENYWVSESVAEYLALRFVEENFGSSETDKMLARKREAASKAGPMLMTGKRPSGTALYQKGSVLLFDLERLIGREKLDSILLRRDRPLSSAAFLAALRGKAGASVADMFEQALLRDGYAPLQPLGAETK